MIMSEDRPHPPVKVTLEDLLRLKRCERPAPEFWTDFERGFRQKQLAALVVRKSWMHNVAAAYRRFGRVGVPVGAVAILGIAVLSIRYESVPSRTISPMVVPRETLARIRPTTVRPVRAVESVGSAAVEMPVRRKVVSAAAPAAASKATPVVAVVSAGLPAQAVDPAAWLGEILSDHASAAELTPSARSIAVNYAAAAVNEPELVESVTRPLGFESRALPAVRAQHAAEVLPTAVAVTESRRNRLLASLDTGGREQSEVVSPEPARRSVLRNLSQENWDRSMGRLEAEGDRLSIRF